MNAPEPNTANFSWAWKLIGIVCLLLLVGVSTSVAQNTKGDKPATNRESRFKTPFKKSNQKRRPTSAKRVRTKKSVASRAGAPAPRRASGGDRPGRPTRPIAATQPKSKQKAWRGDIAGYKIRARSSAGSSRNVYPQYGRYTHNPSKTPSSKQTPVSNRGTLARLKQLETRQGPTPRKQRKVVPRTASSSFTARKSINVYANFARPKRKGEQASTRDIAGRPLRKKNFESPRPSVQAPIFKPYAGRKAMGDKPYKGPSGGFRTATRKGQQAWTGDVAGRRIRGRNFTSKKSVEGTPILPSGYRSATRPGETRPGKRALPSFVPGIGANGINRGKGRRPLKGGGSVSGQGWNNNGQAIVVRTPQNGGRAALFQGNIKTRQPLKGGGSVSGRVWNNNGQPLVVRTPQNGARAALFQGNIKTGRPVKGGGSVSGKLWNNNETAIPGRTFPAESKRVSGYPGRMKRFEVQPGFADMGETFTGYIKLKKFRKNYVQHPDAAEESIKKKRMKNAAFDAEGLQVRVKRPNYVENKNASADALLKLKPSRATYQAGELQVKVKQPEYGRKPNAAEGSLPGKKPSKSSVKASEYARSVRRNWDYVRNPSSSEDALKTREPGKAFAKVSAYQGNVKMHKYVLFERNRALHPDTKFIKTNKNNVDEERDALTNFKLWWARLFKKEEAQPDHLKYKGKKPRYDKGEDGMWYE